MTGIDASGILALRSQVLQRSAALGQPVATPATTPPFARMLGDVSKLQEAAGSASAAFDRGDTTDIAQVMLARQKAGIAFEATLQVRNKLLGAYRDIMNMPV